MSKGRSFTWNDRLSLIKHYNPTDEQACEVFGISQSELDVARSQLRAGVFSDNTNIDYESYGDLFASAQADGQSASVTSTVAPSRPGTTVTSTKAAPESATAKTREPKKRGRKGDKIVKAFTAIPSTPTSAEDFAKTHGVSIAVLRQSKRFDETGIPGTVKVKKDKASKTLMIWRESV
jgi:hypothetical protein